MDTTLVVVAPKDTSPQLSAAAIRLSGVTRSFGAKTAVADLNLEVPRGSFFGICGPNGAGKTTTLRMVTGLLRPSSGRVLVAGADVWADPTAAKRRYGFVPDQPTLFDRLNATELLQFTGALRGMDPTVVARRSEELLAALTLQDEPRTLIADYSLGMTKKIALAVAVLHNPEVLILDEPFGSLDPVNTGVLVELLRRHRRGGGTVVFSSHVMEVVERLCDEVVIMHNGRVIAHGPVDEVRGGQPLQDAFIALGDHEKFGHLFWHLGIQDQAADVVQQTCYKQPFRMQDATLLGQITCNQSGEDAMAPEGVDVDQ